MLDVKDFSLFEKQNNFDFKSFLIKIVSYWKWFIVSLAITFFIAYQVNIRKQKIFGIDTTIGVSDENNPLFTSNTSLVFNWGGTSDKVQSIATTFKSRSHNEMVVDSLQFYTDYFIKTDYYYKDVYGQIPFKVTIDKSKFQLYNQFVKFKMTSSNTFQISIPFTQSSVEVIKYADGETKFVSVNPKEFVANYRVNQVVDLPFLSFILTINDKVALKTNQEVLVRFNSFNQTVSKYRKINISIDEKAASILRLSLEGTNKERMVDYLNSTVEILKKKQLDNKNLFAKNTIAFIDETLSSMENQLKDSGNELKDFSRNNNVLDIQDKGAQFKGQLLEYDVKKDEVERKIAYLNTLKNYLTKSVDFSKLPAPTVAGIEEPNIVNNVAKIIEFSIKRSDLKYTSKGNIFYQRLDSEIESIKKVLLENINSLRLALQYDLDKVNSKLAEIESDIRKLPESSQQYLKISRKYNLSDNIYNTYLQKRSEASIVKAANLSDIKFIDPAKDVGEGLLGPKTKVNYVLALLIGIIIPLVIIFLFFFINNSIQNIEDISSVTKIPLIGIVGIKHNENNLSVFERPKSALSESFRAIRSSLQFLYKKQSKDGAKTLMLTSSISGEGKTFCSINIATVFALSEKKTIILGLDLRKPKIFDDFNIRNEIGAVNYLIGQKTLDEVIQKTHIPYLDVITSGPIP
ncbi:GumC family protein, partial [Flavobacterium sp.]|uniref:GumC family protein n=1 Tax=Flavobacterium sp. TaxID=239 RepID=UPI002FD92B1E